jgi:cathepsin D
VLTIGGYDESLAASEIKWYDIDGRDFWSLRASNVLVNNEDIGLCSDTCKLLFDTGTSVVTFPHEDLEIVRPYLEMDDCSKFKELPTF